MLSKLTYIMGFTIMCVGIFLFMGPAVVPIEYLYAVITIVIGIVIIWLGNKDLFKKDSPGVGSDKNT